MYKCKCACLRKQLHTYVAQNSFKIIRSIKQKIRKINARLCLCMYWIYVHAYRRKSTFSFSTLHFGYADQVQTLLSGSSSN